MHVDNGQQNVCIGSLLEEELRTLYFNLKPGNVNVARQQKNYL